MTNVILVTGGAGYVGSHACKALAESGYQPVTYDNLSTGNAWAVRWGPLEVGDIRDRTRMDQVLTNHVPLAVMHFAGVALVGESVAEPALYYDVNLGGTISVIDACRKHGINNFILSSTCAVYGVPGRIPVDESAALAPINPYGASKQCAERALAECGSAFGISYAILRYFNAAGADPEARIGECRRTETHLIPVVLATTARGGPVCIHGTDYPTPDGTAVRDYIHVADLAIAHVTALRSLVDTGSSLVANLGTGSGHSVREVVAAAERVTGRRVPCLPGPRRAGDPPVLVADASWARRRLGLRFDRSETLDVIVRDAWRWHTTSTEKRAA